MPPLSQETCHTHIPAQGTALGIDVLFHEAAPPSKLSSLD